MYQLRSLTVLIMIYFAWFHSIIEYGIIFWGNSVDSKRVFSYKRK